MELKNIRKITDENGNGAVSLIVNRAELKWAFLDRPSEMSGKFEVTIELDDATAKEYINLCKKLWDEYKQSKKLKASPQAKGFGELKDEDGNPTGKYKIVAKAVHTTQKGKVLKRPPVLDTAKQVIDLSEYPTIGNGTVADVKIVVKPYEFNKQHGISVRLEAVRIVKLVEYAGAGLDVDEFDDIEDEDF